MTEMKAAKCGNEIRDIFLNYNAMMGKNREGGREGREGREGGSHFCQRTESQRRGRGARLLCSLS